jgi:hypothetical protein
MADVALVPEAQPADHAHSPAEFHLRAKHQPHTVQAILGPAKKPPQLRNGQLIFRARKVCRMQATNE